MKSFKPNIGIIIIVLILIISAVVIVANKDQTATTNSSASQMPYSSNSTLAANAQKDGVIGEYYDGSQSAATASPTPTPKPVDIKLYVYPGSVVKISTPVKLEMESNQDADQVTEWYKNKIKDLNFNAKSFSQSSTNGVVFNKLSAAKPGDKIDITIKKDQTSSKLLITVDRS